jgi:hypothetical protein
VTSTTQQLPTPREAEHWIAPQASRAPPWQQFRDLFGRRWLGVFSAVVLIYLFMPVIVTVMFSYNDNLGRYNFFWHCPT